MAPFSAIQNSQSFNISSLHALKAIRKDYLDFVKLIDIEEYYENNDFQETEKPILNDILRYYKFKIILRCKYWNIVKLILMHLYVIYESDCLYKLLELVNEYKLHTILRQDYDFSDEEFTNTNNTELHDMIFNNCNGNYAYIIAITNDWKTRSFYRHNYELKNDRTR